MPGCGIAIGADTHRNLASIRLQRRPTRRPRRCGHRLGVLRAWQRRARFRSHPINERESEMSSAGKGLRVTGWAICAALLAACGGGSRSEAPAPVPTSPPVPVEPPAPTEPPAPPPTGFSLTGPVVHYAYPVRSLPDRLGRRQRRQTDQRSRPAPDAHAAADDQLDVIVRERLRRKLFSRRPGRHHASRHESAVALRPRQSTAGRHFDRRTACVVHGTRRSCGAGSRVQNRRSEPIRADLKSLYEGRSTWHARPD